MDSPNASTREAIAADAAAWFAKLDAGTADAVAFEQWRNDPLHAAAFARIAATDLALDRVIGLARQDDPDLKAAALSRRGAMGLGAGAAAVAIAGSVWAVSARRLSASTPVGGRATIALPDGGKVVLNTDSKVSWKYDRSSRRIWLEKGEANLVVPMDPRPCSFTARDTTVDLSKGSVVMRILPRAVGLSMLKGTSNVSTTSGRDGETTFVGEGDALLSTLGETHVQPMTDDDVNQSAGWLQGELIFNGQTLDVAVHEYNRYLTSKLEIADPALSSLRLGGRFTTHDPSAFLTSLQATFGIHAVRSQDGPILLTR